MLDTKLREQIEQWEQLKPYLHLLDDNYSLGTYYSERELPFTTSCLHLTFNGSPEALETAMKKEIVRLNKEGYPNIDYISPLELEAMEASQTNARATKQTQKIRLPQLVGI